MKAKDDVIYLRVDKRLKKRLREKVPGDLSKALRAAGSNMLDMNSKELRHFIEQGREREKQLIGR
jgi:hypothetical protein